MKRCLWLTIILVVLVGLPSQAAVKPLTYVVHGSEAQRQVYSEILDGFTKETGYQ